MFSRPSAAQALDRRACRVIRRSKSRLACAGCPAGGTKGHSIMIPPTEEATPVLQAEIWMRQLLNRAGDGFKKRLQADDEQPRRKEGERNI